MELKLDSAFLLKWLVVILTFILLLSFLKMYQLDKNNSELLEDYKKKLKDEVNYRNEVITELEESNERSKAIILNLENENNDYVHRLDSLKALKQRIKTIYIEKIIEVNNYTVLEVEEYWKNKFNK